MYFKIFLGQSLAIQQSDRMSGSGDGQKLLDSWARLKRLPFGAWLFAKILGKTIPYSGTIAPQILCLEPCHARIGLKDRLAVRNHLRSIHAIALANVCEIASGLALITSLPANARCILVDFHVTYQKKARGFIVAESRTNPVSSNAETDIVVDVQAKDEAGDIVATAQAKWHIGPKI